MTFTATALSPDTFDGSGGKELRIEGTFEIGHRYRVHIGDTGTTLDPQCYSGIPGQGNLAIPKTVDYITVYSPRLVADLTGHDVLIVDVDTLQMQLLSGVAKVAEIDYGTSVYSIRKVLPPKWRAGPRKITRETPT